MTRDACPVCDADLQAGHVPGCPWPRSMPGAAYDLDVALQDLRDALAAELLALVAWWRRVLRWRP